MKKSLFQSRNLTLLLYAGMGLLAGACLALIGVEIILAGRVNQFQASLSLATPISPTAARRTLLSPTSLPTASPTPTRLLPTPTRFVQSIIDQADAFLDDGQPDKVKDVLLPHISEFTTSSDLALIYARLGQAEMDQGHYQLAAVYYEHLFAHQPGAENLYTLAACYDAGGNLESALAKYRILIRMDDPQTGQYRDSAEERIKDLSEVLGTPTP
jgi:tetratricopeptide (TPR) repeat protein